MWYEDNFQWSGAIMFIFFFYRLKCWVTYAYCVFALWLWQIGQKCVSHKRLILGRTYSSFTKPLIVKIFILIQVAWFIIRTVFHFASDFIISLYTLETGSLLFLTHSTGSWVETIRATKCMSVQHSSADGMSVWNQV